MKYTIKEFRKQFPDDAACLAYIFALRCPKGTKCAKCEKADAFHPVGRWRAYECACGAFFSPCAGTIFHKSPTPLTLWFHAIFLFATAKNGVSAMELTRQLGVTYKCAWRMARQVRLLMAQDDGLNHRHVRGLSCREMEIYWTLKDDARASKRKTGGA